MTARSVVLSVLLGTHPASLSSAELLRLTVDFGIKETALRVALTRMVAAGDLIRAQRTYRLSDRLLERQRRQDEALNPRTRHWNGDWLTVVVTSVGNDSRTRAALRTAMSDRRFGELREGVWLRPNNLDADLDADIRGHARVLIACDAHPAELADRLWDLTGWMSTGRQLLEEMAAAVDVPGRFATAAAIVRHLRCDPVLPPELLPADWPGDRLRAAYAQFVAELSERLSAAQPLEVR
ncbi:PaaX domain-containing protein, C- domain protein [Mycobacterium sp. M1]|uniref:PaaX domain-containing protein, C- domain protein n=1 Tax=Mycolicibacter acidiphilus TaxID=2835306 RepID=A0ABS5RKW2_9MYCO|nr:PaaX family transcriptional regulator C-terminal domain-containing protein [Mycolicibacter acidiphilus]MBS9534931.1 PaaX domain-containing protein, C- domain protein [Mycolicibacter acidiphilus]